MKIKIYLSDEGFGHLVRQEAILKELFKLIKNLDVTIQTKEKLKFAKEKFGKKASYIEKHNGIQTVKTPTGKLNIRETKRVFLKYEKMLPEIIKEEVKEVKKEKYDLIISDSVPHAHEVAHICGIDSVGVFHFDWVWFCRNSLNGLDDLTQKMLSFYKKSDVLYTPPFCPQDIINSYDNIKQVPFIINDFDKIDVEKTDRKKVLVMDNGTSNLSSLIIKNLDIFEELKSFIFYIDAKLVKSESDNVKKVFGLKKIHSLIPHVDIVIARAGFNTMTESIITKTPGLFISESNNPEIKHNVDCALSEGLCGVITPDQFRNNFKNSLKKFMAEDYELIFLNLNNSNYNSNGSKEIAKRIKRMQDENKNNC